MEEQLSEHLKAKYPTARRAPMADCEHCQGKGERWYESHSPYSRSMWRPCLCIFVRHDYVPLVSDVIRTLVARETHISTGRY